MKRALVFVVLLAFVSLAAMAEKRPSEEWNALGVVHNAHYVYVTSYDGPQFSTDLLPEDRTAISTVQNAIEHDGYMVVYSPRQADMILAVQARGSSDLLAVYAGKRLGPSTYLWRAEAKDGLSSSNPVLIERLEHALQRVNEKE